MADKYDFYAYPVTIIKDRYMGSYSGALFTAWNCHEDMVPSEPSNDDVTCQNFWHYYAGIVGKGATAQEAHDDLARKLNDV